MDGADLLDVGSGEGFFAEAAIRCGFRVVALDYLKEGARRTAKLIGAQHTLRGSVTALPFLSASFDVVTAWDLLEHLPIPEQALQELARVLRPNGLLAISTPNPVALSVRCRGADSIQFRDPTHVSVRPKEDWCRLLRHHGFAICRLGGDGWWDAPYRPSWLPSKFWSLGAQIMFATRFCWPIESGENTVILARREEPPWLSIPRPN